MPVFRQSDPIPAWCKLRFFEIVDLAPGETHLFPRMARREKILVLKGSCQLQIQGIVDEADTASGGRAPFEAGAKCSLDSVTGQFAIPRVYTQCHALRVCGDWGEACETFGLFTPASRVPPRDEGDPVDYPKTNGMDSHYHDCDEYWFITAGRGRVVSEKTAYEVEPGDCVATGMGHHHDFPVDLEPVTAVYLETDLEGMKRQGHLWEYRHGPAVVKADRV